MDYNTINIFHGDSISAMQSMKNNQYDLAHCDVNYGIKQDGRSNKSRGKLAKSKDYSNNARYDDLPPDPEYFDLLKRKSKDQILWGANHFIDNMPFNVSSPCWIVWNKLNGNTDFADCELAWTSFKTAVRIFNYRWQGMLQQDMKNKEIISHPNQKPVALYKWSLDKYAKKGFKILDSHGGSCNHAIACIDMGFDLDIYELDKDYYDSAVKRIKNYVAQTDLSRPPVQINYITL